jgi:hypothetical protein
MKNIAIDSAKIKSIIEGNYVYVDKTKYIHQILSAHTYYFLSRPRRFGKSLTIDTFKEIFLGNKDLFKEQYIYQTDYKWDVHPIIHLDFNQLSNDTTMKMKKSIKDDLLVIAKKHEINLDDDEPENIFKRLIISLSQKYQKGVVFLVDEYDKPIISHIGKGDERLQIAIANQEFMKSFYDNLKALEEHLRLVFMTGVSKFSKVSVFSTLNNLIELDSHPQFSDFLGYTQEELEFYFDPHFESMAESMQIDKAELYRLFKAHYNGFRFTNKPAWVYNPFSVGRALSLQEINNYWFDSGTPSFLVNLIKEKQFDLTSLENLEFSSSAIKAYDIRELQIIPLLFQTGYLTIKDSFEYGDMLVLTIPNLEVRKGFNSQLLSIYKNNDNVMPTIYRMKKLFEKEEFEEYFDMVKSVFTSILNNLIPKQDNVLDQVTKLSKFESYYHSLYYLLTSLMSDAYTRVYCEILNNIGRLDMAIETPNIIYIIEFKVDQALETAFKQIIEKKYADRYLKEGRSVKMLAINFSSKDKNVENWEVRDV